MTIREAAKKVLFLVARPLRPFPPPPSCLGYSDMKREIKRFIYSYVYRERELESDRQTERGKSMTDRQR